MTIDDKLAFDIREVMAITPFKRSALYQAMAEGRLEAQKLGRRTFITRDALKRFIAAQPAYEPERESEAA